MNSRQLIFTGVVTMLPLQTVTDQLGFVDKQRFALTPESTEPLGELKLSAKDERFLQVLRGRPTFSELLKRGGFDYEQTLRRLYALGVMQAVDFADAVGAQRAPTPLPTRAASTTARSQPEQTWSAPPPPEPRPEPIGVPYADEDDAARNALAAEFLEHRLKGPFELLEVYEDVQPLTLRRAFMMKADRFSPVRFRSPELREKAETLLAAYARAYATLSDPEQVEQFRRRRQLAQELSPGAGTRARDQRSLPPGIVSQPPLPAMLDADSQFAEGERAMNRNDWVTALEHFQNAFDIEPKGTFRTYLAWVRYKVDGDAETALSELAEAARQVPGSEEVWAFSGQIQLATGQRRAAEESFRRALRLNPTNRRYAEVLNEMYSAERAAMPSIKTSVKN